MPDATDLSRLHDIVVPPPAPLWPPAPGMAITLALVAIVVLALLLRAFIRWQHNRYRREALRELKHIEAEARVARVARASSPCGSRDMGFQPMGSEVEVEEPPPAAIATLLKRTALTAFPRATVASLTGAPWFAFLDATAGTTAFAATIGPLLDRATCATGAFAPEQTRALAAAARHWIKHHKKPAP